MGDKRNCYFESNLTALSELFVESELIKASLKEHVPGEQPEIQPCLFGVERTKDEKTCFTLLPRD